MYMNYVDKRIHLPVFIELLGSRVVICIKTYIRKRLHLSFCVMFIQCVMFIRCDKHSVLVALYLCTLLCRVYYQYYFVHLLIITKVHQIIYISLRLNRITACLQSAAMLKITRHAVRLEGAVARPLSSKQWTIYLFLDHLHRSNINSKHYNHYIICF